MNLREKIVALFENLRPSRSEVRFQREHNLKAIAHYQSLNNDLETLRASLKTPEKKKARDSVE